MNWPRVTLDTPAGAVDAIAPWILSASRATDIPAFHADWFMNKLQVGQMQWKNPFNGRLQMISLENTRFIVFWSKHPQPFVKYLDLLDERGINYYFLYTMNDYEAEGYEPNLPPMEARIDTFRALSDKIGKEKVIWRFDPLILTDKVDVPALLGKAEAIGNALADYTEKLVFSFADIDNYKKVQNNLKREQIKYRDFDQVQQLLFAEGLANLNKSWQLKLAACCESQDFSALDIEVSSCVDDRLIRRIAGEDEAIMKFLGPPERRAALKDRGQRAGCGCIASKDIGWYNTCPFLCSYCYANTSTTAVQNTMKRLGR